MIEFCFWIFLSLCLLSIPLVMIILGRIMAKHPPKEINSIYGYRTSRSMKNLDTWKFANTMFGKLWFRGGWGVLVFTIAGIVWLYGKDVNTTSIESLVVVGLQFIPLVGTIVPVEIALRRNFDDDGNRRDNKGVEK